MTMHLVSLPLLVLFFLLPNVRSIHADHTGQPHVTHVSRGSALAAALMNNDIETIYLTRDVMFQGSDWGPYHDMLPVPISRNVTVAPAPDLAAGTVVLDFNFLADMVQLVPGHMLQFKDVVSVNFRPGAIRLAPGLGLLAPSPEPAPGEMRPILQLLRGAMVNRLCWSDRVAQQANAALQRRPPELPGRQSYYAFTQGGGANANGTCVNSSSVPPLERCWVASGNNTDYALEAQQLGAVAASSTANYVIHLFGTLTLCEHLVPDTCLLTKPPIACWADAAQALSAEQPLRLVAEAQPGAEAEGAAAADGKDSGDGSGGGGPELRVVLPAVLAGVAGGALVVALAVLLVRRHRRRQQYLQEQGQQGAPACSKQQQLDAQSQDIAEAMTSSNATGDTGACSPPVRCTSRQQQALEALKLGSVASGPSGRSLCVTEAVPSASSMVPLTGRSPLSPHVRLDLRYGVDVVVDDCRMRGAGSFGRVLEGSYLGMPVAVKLLHSSLQQHKAAPATAGVASFRYEVEVLSRCSHPNVVGLLGACLEPPNMCLVMELMDQSLEQLMQHHTNVLPMEQVLCIAQDVARGLAYLHPTVMHRDLKPANVLLDAAGNAKLTDFGLARLHETVCATQCPEAGTAPYQAPECFDPEAHNVVTHKADIFSWAVMVWEMLACKRPWHGRPQLAIAFAVTFQKARLPLAGLPDERCPPRLAHLLAECWDEDPKRRPSAEEVVKRLALLQHSMAAGSAQASATGSRPSSTIVGRSLLGVLPPLPV